MTYTENWCFDGLFGHFPEADGIPAAQVPQADRDGAVPPHLQTTLDKGKDDPCFPADLPGTFVG